MTILVVHPIRQEDTSPARKWGEFKYINDRYTYGDELWPILTAAVDSAPQWTLPPVVSSRIAAAAKAYDPDRDYVLIGGDHLQLMFLVVQITHYHGQLKVLRFDKKIADYIPVRFGRPVDTSPASVVGSDTDIGDTSGQDSDEGVEYDAEQYLNQGGAGPVGGLDEARQKSKAQRRRDFLDGK